MGLNLNTIFTLLPGVIIALTIHEFCHAYAAFLLGDPTAKEGGRITLNPLKHIDPLGMLVLLVAGFGWAKPVQFHPENLKNPDRDRMIIAAAGPLSNLVTGILFLLIIKLLLATGVIPEGRLFYRVFNFLLYTGIINLSLFIFNMIPIPPLDGSHILFTSIRINKALEEKLYRYGSLALLAIILLERNTGLDIIPIEKFIQFVLRLVFPAD